jgi:hypothetical protein
VIAESVLHILHLAGLKYRVKLDRAIIGLVIGDRPTFQNFLSERDRFLAPAAPFPDGSGIAV